MAVEGRTAQPAMPRAGSREVAAFYEISPAARPRRRRRVGAPRRDCSTPASRDDAKAEAVLDYAMLRADPRAVGVRLGEVPVLRPGPRTTPPPRPNSPRPSLLAPTDPACRLAAAESASQAGDLEGGPRSPPWMRSARGASGRVSMPAWCGA